MPVWLVKVLHFIGLTNLSDQDVERYVWRACVVPTADTPGKP